MADDVITSISIKVNASTADATKKIDALATKLQKLRDSSHGLKLFGDSLKQIADATSRINGNFLNDLTKGMKNLESSAKRASQATSAVKNAVTGTKPQFADKEQKQSKIDAMFSGEQAYKGLSILPSTPLEKIATKAYEIGQAFKSAGKAIAGGFLTGLRKSVVLMAKIGVAPWKRLGSAVKSVTGRVAGFFAALKRVAVYRAIRTALKAITQGFKEGMSNLYQYSLLMDGQFSKSMDSLATSALYLKNSLGAMTAPIVNALAPAVDLLADKFVDLLNMFNQLVAALTGASTWTKALKYPKAYAEATDGANGKAKELRATLLGFDEINRLDDNSKGSRGSASEELDYSKMFEEQAVSSATEGWAQKVQQAFESADFTGVGKSIGNALKNALDNIKWSSIKEKVNNATKSFTTLINGIVDVKGLGTSIGESIAEAINVSVESMYTFTSTIDWDGIGKFLADGINGAVKKIDTKKIGQSIGNTISGALKASTSFLSTVDFEQIGKRVGELIKNIDWGQAFQNLGSLIATAIRKLPNLAEGAMHIVEAIGSGILQIIPKLPGIAWEIIKALGDALSGLWQIAKNAGLDVFNSIKDGLVEKVDTLKNSARVLWTNIREGIEERLGKAFQLGKDVFERIKGGFLYGIDKLKTIGSDIMTNLWEGIESAWKWVKSKVKAIADYIKDLFTFNFSLSTSSGHGGGHAFASGGTAQTGEIFLARESGPELVAQVGHKTQIANNDQIVGAIETATANANAEGNTLLRQAVGVLTQLLNKETTVVAEITTDSITNGLARQNRRNGRAVVPVGG